MAKKYNDKVIIPGRYNVVKFDPQDNIIYVISLQDPHWLKTYGKDNLQSDADELEWAEMVWDSQDDDDYPEEDDANQTFRWSIIGPQGQLIHKGCLKTWNADGDCIWLE
jgi:hypothetical protein